MTMNLIIPLLLSLPLRSTSFAPATRLAAVTHRPPGDALLWPTAVVSGDRSTTLAAKKRRRRKANSAPVPTAGTDELPDFDDGEAEDVAEVEPVVEAIKPRTASSSAPSSPIKRGSGLSAQLAEEVGGNVDGLDEDVIMGAMRGKGGAWQPPRSIQDTLSDRRLEKFMDFDRMIEQDGRSGDVVDLPDFDEVIARRKQREGGGEGAAIVDTSGMGKKAARNAQRRAAAVQREAELEEETSPFEGLNILKLLENGAWVGIGLLVVWEIYINSPFFERASPLIPVVYDSVPGM